MSWLSLLFRGEDYIYCKVYGSLMITFHSYNRKTEQNFMWEYPNFGKYLN